MPWSDWKYFNFRATAGFVTDPAGSRGVLASDTYPVTNTIGGESITYGYTVVGNLDSRDRTNTAGREKLAGMHFLDSGVGLGPATFQVDLDQAGAHLLRLALGEAADVAAGYSVEIYDNATLLATLSGATTGNDRWDDAAGTEFASAAAWLSGNAALSFTFASTTLKLKFNNTAIAGARWGTLGVSPVVASGGATAIEV